MAKLLRDLLDATEPTFTMAVRKLEELTDKNGVDTKLIGDIVEKSHSAIRGLGLDSNDTTGKELYFALNNKVKEHNKNLAKSLGTSEDAPIREIVPKLVDAVDQVDVPRRCWVLKKSVAKNLLREMPPKNMMKKLGYRSLESMFKNENFAELYTGLRFSEGPDWLNKYNELFEHKVLPSDFENREVEIVVMDHNKWVDMAESFAIKNFIM